MSDETRHKVLAKKVHDRTATNEETAELLKAITEQLEAMNTILKKTI